MDEFDLIEKYFAPLTNDGGPAFGLKDDAAIWSPPEDKSLVISKDIMVSGVHFFENEAPELIARKLLRVNLSDLAASGAKPEGYLLGLSLDDTVTSQWLKRFTEGLKKDQTEFGITLFGGDTVKAKSCLCLSLTIIGSVDKGKRMGRDMAQAGDDIYVTGSIGDAALGLKCLKKEIPFQNSLVERLQLPTPRLEIGAELLKIGANSAVDISDGLLADLGHILKASDMGAEVQKEAIPLSPEAINLLQENLGFWVDILGGGDDYEVLFTCAPDKETQIRRLEKSTNVKITKIGTIIEDKALRLLDQSGQEEEIKKMGYNHFKG